MVIATKRDDTITRVIHYGRTEESAFAHVVGVAGCCKASTEQEMVGEMILESVLGETEFIYATH